MVVILEVFEDTQGLRFHAFLIGPVFRRQCLKGIGDTHHASQPTHFFAL